MKLTAFAIALLAGTAAIAGPGHDAHKAATTAEATVDNSAAVSSDPAIDTAAAAPAPADQSLAAPPPAGDSATSTLASAAPAASSAVVQPGNENPERDARGIKVISAEATVPPGFNGLPAGVAEGGPELDPATGEPTANASAPPCTREVTDNCLQTYERGRKPA